MLRKTRYEEASHPEFGAAHRVVATAWRWQGSRRRSRGHAASSCAPASSAPSDGAGTCHAPLRRWPLVVHPSTHAREVFTWETPAE